MDNDTSSQGRSGLTPGAQRAAALRMRQCALTREEMPVEQLLRFVLGPDRTIAPDLSGRLGGRGVWITATRPAVTAAVQRGVFAKALKTKVSASATLADQIDLQLRERVRQSLSFAAKAGLVVTGFVKVEAALEGAQVRALVQASDAADDGLGKLARKYLAIASAQGRTPRLVRYFSSAELSMALGRTNVVHAALAEGGQTSAFLREGLRLERFRLNDKTQSAATVGAETVSASPLDRASRGPIGLDTDNE